MTTPTVYEQVPVGSILLREYNMNMSDPKNISSFFVVGHNYVFSIIGDSRFSVEPRVDYDFDEDMHLASNPLDIQYLREKARKYIGSIIQECEEGILDD